MVYFIQAKTLGFIKIGYCNENGFKTRFGDLRTSSPDELVPMGALHFSEKEIERDLHIQFAQSRVRGEWFLPTEELLIYIAQYARKVDNFREPVSGISCDPTCRVIEPTNGMSKLELAPPKRAVQYKRGYGNIITEEEVTCRKFK